ncbi:MAG TPA: SDR family NAD(P)-dependent oxidoreductase [Pseudonocardiaceae bacterium]|jgi:NAD(P)-dependent dehydrogenase (short-subunit alcohol dehydrogenase family)
MAGRTQEMVDRVVVITGASRGVGELLAESFSVAGASVGLLARDEAAIKEVAGRLAQPAIAVACDVADEDSVADAFDQLADRLGRIDSVVANAGIATGSGRAHKVDASMWRSIVDVNLTGTFLTARAAYPYLAASGKGRLVLTSSVMATLPRRGVAAYAASKAGIEGLARALAADWATDGITVNAVAPGFLDVGMGNAFHESERLREQVSARTPTGRFGGAAELADVVRFLAGESSSYVTGQVLAVDGGYGLG